MLNSDLDADLSGAGVPNKLSGDSEVGACEAIVNSEDLNETGRVGEKTSSFSSVVTNFLPPSGCDSSFSSTEHCSMHSLS